MQKKKTVGVRVYGTTENKHCLMLKHLIGSLAVTKSKTDVLFSVTFGMRG